MNIDKLLSRNRFTSSVSAPSPGGGAVWRAPWRRLLLPMLSVTGSSARRALLPIVGIAVMILGFSVSSASGSMPAGTSRTAVSAYSSASSASATGATASDDPSFDRAPRPSARVNVVDGLAPVRLIIPKMRLNALILGLGPDRNGAMQAPRIGRPNDPIWSEVYWWNVGAMPGQTGNAVIAGHVNRPDASPSTFTYLNRLVPGDQIQVVTRDGHVLLFVVTAKGAPLVYLDRDNDSTIQRIFGPAITPNLNLITCWGEWDGKQFNRRLVVYSKLVGPSPFPAATSAVTVS